MLSIHALLNPATTPERPPPLDYDISSADVSPTEVVVSNIRATRNTHHPRFREWATATDPRQRGPVNFPPHENLSESAYNEVCRFRVRPLGQIRKSFEHIPYNSSKKDFYSKTGREGIEAFSYEFTAPGRDGSDTQYKVLWDYNVGLVRITPFFKCLGFAKTKPHQMLEKNPGLRSITPSITGGAVSAQGYWMPFHCARAVCATFCYPIAGALIPIFGPSFPSQCRTPEDPLYQDMKIDPAVIQEATRRRAVVPRAPAPQAPLTPPLLRHGGASLEPQPEVYARHVLPPPPPPPRNPSSPSHLRHQRLTSSWRPINGPSRGREASPSAGETTTRAATGRERLQLPSVRRRGRFSSPPAGATTTSSSGSRLGPTGRMLLPRTPRSLSRPEVQVLESNSSKRQCRQWDGEPRSGRHDGGEYKPADRAYRQEGQSGRVEEYHAATTLMGLRRDR